MEPDQPPCRAREAGLLAPGRRQADGPVPLRGRLPRGPRGGAQALGGLSPRARTNLLAALGQALFDNVPREPLLHFIPYHVPAFAPRGQGLVVTFASLKQAKGPGGTVYHSGREPKVERHGEAWRCLFEGCEDGDGGVWLDLKYYRAGQLPVTEWELRQQREQAQAASQHKPEPVPVGQPPPPRLDVAAGEEGEAKESELVPVERVPPPTGLPTDRNVSAKEHEPLPTEEAPPPRKLPPKLNVRLADLASEPDSFVRQKEALYRLARYLKRVPSQGEALRYLREERLYTPPWDQHLARRRARVASASSAPSGSASRRTGCCRKGAWPAGPNGSSRRYVSASRTGSPGRSSGPRPPRWRSRPVPSRSVWGRAFFFDEVGPAGYTPG